MNVVKGSCIRLRQNVQAYIKWAVNPSGSDKTCRHIWAAEIPDANTTSAHVLEKEPVGMSEAEAALPLGSGKR